MDDEIELLDGASAEFDMELVTKGELSPVFFGSALTNFGVETFLQHFLKMTYAPMARKSDIGMIDPFQEDFSAFVFKIQANMNKNHRDRIAFMRICSGKFTAGMEVFHVQGNKQIKLSQPQQMMADICAGTFCTCTSDRLHEAQAVCKRSNTDCTGRCHPDFPGIQRRYGGNHSRSSWCAAV